MQTSACAAATKAFLVNRVGDFGFLLGLLLVTLIGVRGLLGEGVLLGGALVPAPEGAGDLWAEYTTAWHQVVAARGEIAASNSRAPSRARRTKRCATRR